RTWRVTSGNDSANGTPSAAGPHLLYRYGPRVFFHCFFLVLTDVLFKNFLLDTPFISTGPHTLRSVHSVDNFFFISIDASRNRPPRPSSAIWNRRSCPGSGHRLAGSHYGIPFRARWLCKWQAEYGSAPDELAS